VLLLRGDVDEESGGEDDDDDADGCGVYMPDTIGCDIFVDIY
jgi:hypothetical protein